MIVTHLFGNPCDDDGDHGAMPRARHSRHRGLAQAFWRGITARRSGTLAIGCFSLQQGKHITTGEGGIVVTNNPDFARRMFLFINKAWGYGRPTAGSLFLALNYRMTELHGAVAVAPSSTSSKTPSIGGLPWQTN